MSMTAYWQHPESENNLKDHQMAWNLICLQNMGVVTNVSVEYIVLTERVTKLYVFYDIFMLYFNGKCGKRQIYRTVN